MKYIKEYVDFEDFDYEEDGNNQVIVFGSGDIVFCGKIVKKFENYRLELLETKGSANDDYNLNVISCVYKKLDDDYLVITKSHGIKLSMLELKKRYDVIIVDGLKTKLSILHNPQNYLYENGN